MKAAEPRTEDLLRLDDVRVVFGESDTPGNRLARWFRKQREPVVALRDVSIRVKRGEALGLVGESGSGKTTIGRAMLGLVKATSGRVTYAGADVGAMNRADLRDLRARLQMMYQDSLGSLDPRMRVGPSVAEPLRIHTEQSRAESRQGAIEALERVGLNPGDDFYARYPNELSGGQQQRAVLARALVTRPEALVLDEPLSGADVSIRVRLLDLFMELRAMLNLTYVFITHDLALARYVCDRIVILYRGEVVESGSTDAIFADPRHPYTRALIQAVPSKLKARGGDVESRLVADAITASVPDACPLYGRCPIGVGGVCDVLKPPLEGLRGSPDHLVACHYAEPSRAFLIPSAAQGEERSMPSRPEMDDRGGIP
jgi:oligopeptide/dipeptide ABC transporter ATP-binding protein